MILRAEKTQRLVINSPIFPKMSYSIQNDKFVRFISTGLREESDGRLTNDEKMTVYLLKYKTKSDAAEVVSHIKSVIDAISEW